MKKIISALFIISFFASSCTHLDGDIGDWFGSWHLEQMLIDGQIDETYAKNQKNVQVMISFQGKVFNIAYLNGDEIYGTWSYAGEILTLIAGYNTGGGSNSSLFNPFPVVLHLPADVEQIEITVTRINGSTMQWQYIDQNGQLITYNWRKYP